MCLSACHTLISRKMFYLKKPEMCPMKRFERDMGELSKTSIQLLGFVYSFDNYFSIISLGVFYCFIIFNLISVFIVFLFTENTFIIISNTSTI